MIKVVVVDDEVNVCRLICNLVDWHSFGMEIVAVAHSGVDALDCVRAHLPDLMLTDIRMPGYDGLELIARARDIKEDLDFIIISGYRHFEYAKRAVQFQVQDYILKPVKKDELAAALQKMQKKYTQKSNQASIEEQLSQRLRNDAVKLRSRLFSDFLQNKDVFAPGTQLDAVNRDYHFDFRAGVFQIFVAKIDCPSVEQFNNAKGVLTDKLAQILRKALAPGCFDVQLAAEGSRLFGVVNMEDGNRAMLRRQFKTALDDFLPQASVFGDISLTIGLGSPVRALSELAGSLGSADSAVAQRLLEGAGILIEGRPPRRDSAGGQGLERQMSELKAGLDGALKTLDGALLVSALDGFRESCFEAEPLDGQMLYGAVSDAHQAFVDMLGERYGGVGSQREGADGFAQRADLCAAAADLFDILADELSKALAEAIKEISQSEARPMRLAKQYIQENYASQITLEKLAAVTGFNPTYFSTLFKKENNRNFLEYLSEVRMKKACELLKETNKTIVAICEEVGYSDLKHFNKVFKKHAGLKPNEYRKLFS